MWRSIRPGLRGLSSSLQQRSGRSTFDVRRDFIRFFEQNDHVHVPSSSVLPEHDPTLLFTNAGMNQFKHIITGTADDIHPSGNRLVNYQKCIRAGGKHNDLDDVGKDLHHQTFFEMLGNWSFHGAYGKRRACELAWSFLTHEMDIEPDRLYVSYFGGNPAWGVPADDECRQIWLDIGLPPSRVLPFMSENFWEMGAVGPCGPCTEIHYDRVKDRKDASSLVNVDDSVVELWNIVFMSYLRDASSRISPLPSLHIDTGMGLERLASVAQGVNSNFDTDAFTPIMRAINKLGAKHRYSGKVGAEDKGEMDTAYRIIADHMRAVTVSMADGASPAAEDAGFMVRKMLRRAAVRAAQLGVERGALEGIVPVIVNELSPAYSSLPVAEQWIATAVREEENNFWKLLDKGRKTFSSMAVRVEGKGEEGERNVFPGSLAWQLHSAHGLPLEVTEGLAADRGWTVDRRQYEHERDTAKSQSRSQSSLGVQLFVSPSDFPSHGDERKYEYGVEEGEGGEKYVFPRVPARVLGLFDKEGKRVERLTGEGHVVVDGCSFYAEEGGQAADRGQLRARDGSLLFTVHDVQKVNGVSVLRGVVGEGGGGEGLAQGADVVQAVDEPRRLSLMRAHSATHLLNWALRRRGAGEGQRGSAVTEDQLRFDYAAGEEAGEEDVISDVECLLRSAISSNQPITVHSIPLEKARQMSKLQSEFRESKQYPPFVRVIAMGSRVEDATAVECCAGTHVVSTSHIGDVVITSDKGVARGVRRIVALTGARAVSARAYGEQVTDAVRTFHENLKNGSLNWQEAERYRKSISWASLPFTVNGEVNSVFQWMKKERKQQKDRVKKIRAENE